MSSHWYVLRSKPQKEKAVWQQVCAKGIENHYPRIRVNPVNPRARKVKPYFPGYMFVRVDFDDIGLSTLKWMPHSLGLVSFDGVPAPVPDNFVPALKKRIEEINAAGGEVFDGLEPGDAVRIEVGPFAGYEAVFDSRLSGKERVRVLLQLLGNSRFVPMELNVSQIEKVD
ncbi:MAG: transcription termination/antitermination NusG family protein [Chloroflexota bacterium]|nr:transcription termination/antitermination NusG family protein [Chloroflexota bacterium]